MNTPLQPTNKVPSQHAVDLFQRFTAINTKYHGVYHSAGRICLMALSGSLGLLVSFSTNLSISQWFYNNLRLCKGTQKTAKCFYPKNLQFLHLHVCFLVAQTRKRNLSRPTLVHNSAYAPQISRGIIVLGHDSLRSQNADTQIIPQGHSHTSAHLHRNTETLHIHRVHRRAAQHGCHCAFLMKSKPNVSWRVTGTE